MTDITGQAEETPDPNSGIPPAAGAPEEIDKAWDEALSASTPAPLSADGMAMPGDPPVATAHPADFGQLTGDPGLSAGGNIDLLMDVRLPVSIELGRTTLPIAEILKWGQGSIVELDKLVGEPVSLLVNNKMVAKGEVVVIDENFGLRITSLVSPKEHHGAL